jgi:hypothetical protein
MLASAFKGRNRRKATPGQASGRLREHGRQAASSYWTGTQDRRMSDAGGSEVASVEGRTSSVLDALAHVQSGPGALIATISVQGMSAHPERPSFLDRHVSRQYGNFRAELGRYPGAGSVPLRWVSHAVASSSASNWCVRCAPRGRPVSRRRRRSGSAFGSMPGGFPACAWLEPTPGRR